MKPIGNNLSALSRNSKQLNDNLNVKPYQCEQCSKKFTYFKGFQNHKAKFCRGPRRQMKGGVTTVVKLAGPQQLGNTVVLPSTKLNKRRMDQKPYQCDQCSKSFVYQTNFLTHKIIAHNTREIGDDRETNHTTVIKHKVQITDDNVNYSTINYHYHHHQNGGYLMCRECNMLFINYNHLIDHVRCEHRRDQYVNTELSMLSKKCSVDSKRTENKPTIALPCPIHNGLRLCICRFLN